MLFIIYKSYKINVCAVIVNFLNFFNYRGKFGYVYKVTEKSTGNTYAAKFIKITPKSKKEVTEEINLMNKIHHERLVFLYDAYQTSKELIMVMEL